MRLAMLVIVIVLGVPGPALAQRIVRGPYLQRGAPTEMTVVWRTDLPTAGVVVLGQSLGAADATVRVEEPETQHEVRLTGLQPATRYYYSVGDGAELSTSPDDESYFFVTPPEAGISTRFRSWIIGDSGTGNARQALARDGMLKAEGRDPPDLFLHMGDMAYTDGTDGQFQSNFFEPYFLTLRNTVTWPTLGNHEGHSADSATESGPYYDAYVLPRAGESGGLPSGTEAYYAFDHGQVHFVVLDSHDSSRAVDGAMLTWLAADLAATTQPFIIAFWHHPPYSKGSHDSDTEGQLIQMRENALPILEAAGVDLVLGGHSHIYERSYFLAGAYQTPSVAGGGVILDSGDGRVDGDGAYLKGATPTAQDGAVYVVAGHGGASIRQEGTHPLIAFAETELGSCLLDVEGNHLTFTNIRHDGVKTDTVTLVKGAAFVMAAPNGGERIAAGSDFTVTWSTVGGTASSVNLEASYDGGPWETIVSGTPNTGSHTWATPDRAAQRVRLRVSDVAGGVDADSSDGTVTLFQGSDPGPTNRPPVVLPIGDLEVVEDTLVVLQIRSLDPDGDPVRYRVDPLPDGATLDANSGLFTWVPAPDQSGRWWLSFEAVDPQDAAGTGVARITVRDGAGAVGDGGFWPAADGGVDDGGGGGGGTDPKGCGCTSTGGAGASSLLGLLAFAGLFSRRRAVLGGRSGE